jgi:hypothetical protein
MSQSNFLGFGPSGLTGDGTLSLPRGAWKLTTGFLAALGMLAALLVVIAAFPRLASADNSSGFLPAGQELADGNALEQQYAVYYKESKESDPWTFDSVQIGLTAAQDRCTYLEVTLRKFRAAYTKRG